MQPSIGTIRSVLFTSLYVVRGVLFGLLWIVAGLCLLFVGFWIFLALSTGEPMALLGILWPAAIGLAAVALPYAYDRLLLALRPEDSDVELL